MTPVNRTRALARPIARARAMNLAEAGANLRDSAIYGLAAAFIVLIARLGLAAL